MGRMGQRSKDAADDHDGHDGLAIMMMMRKTLGEGNLHAQANTAVLSKNAPQTGAVMI